MGFFSSLLSVGRSVLTGLGVIAPKVVPAVRRIAPAIAGAGAAGVGFAAGEALFDSATGQPLTAQAGRGGNGMTFRRTIVQTVNAADGQIMKQKVLAGAPHLMNRDLIIAKRVFRLSTKLHQKLPKRTVRQSRTKALMTQIIESSLARQALPSCPPVCPS